MAAVVGMISRCGLSIDARHRIQHNQSKVVLYNFYCNNHLKQLCISNKTECFCYKMGVACMSIVCALWCLKEKLTLVADE